LKLSSSSLQKKSNPKKKKLKEHRHTHYLLRLFISKDWKKKDSGHTGRKSGKQPNQSILTSFAAFFAISRNRCFHCHFFCSFVFKQHLKLPSHCWCTRGIVSCVHLFFYIQVTGLGQWHGPSWLGPAQKYK